MQLFDAGGRRLYLNGTEREAFKQAAGLFSGEVETFCHTLLYTGCRISEALALTRDRVDLVSGMLTFESLKKRRKGIYRAVPVPPELLNSLDMAYDIRIQKPEARNQRLWGWNRKTAYIKVKTVMSRAGIEGPHATPKGLRHGFAVACVERTIALNVVQKWLGHAQLATTAIYADAVGEEERNLAARLWV